MPGLPPCKPAGIQNQDQGQGQGQPSQPHLNTTQDRDRQTGQHCLPKPGTPCVPCKERREHMQCPFFPRKNGARGTHDTGRATAFSSRSCGSLSLCSPPRPGRMCPAPRPSKIPVPQLSRRPDVLEGRRCDAGPDRQTTGTPGKNAGQDEKKSPGSSSLTWHSAWGQADTTTLARSGETDHVLCVQHRSPGPSTKRRSQKSLPKTSPKIPESPLKRAAPQGCKTRHTGPEDPLSCPASCPVWPVWQIRQGLSVRFGKSRTAFLQSLWPFSQFCRSCPRQRIYRQWNSGPAEQGDCLFCLFARPATRLVWGAAMGLPDLANRAHWAACPGRTDRPPSARQARLGPISPIRRVRPIREVQPE